jgi:UDP-N-acetylmuramate dehydrogenase
VSIALNLLEGRGRTDAPLGALTTYRVGGRAAVGVTAADLEDLKMLARAVEASGLPVLVVGRGSNLLVADRGWPGIAVQLGGAGAFGRIDHDGATLRAGAAVPLPTLARRSAELGLTGLEWAVGVPGSVGGGVRMNAGGHGSDIAHTLRRCDVADLTDGARWRPWPLAELHYAYRHSSVASTDVVVAAEFALTPGDRAVSRATIREIVRWRREHQPGGNNAGSVFANPEGEPPANAAGWLIEAAGCKGRRHASASVSTKHANFIQADSGGSADDVRALLEEVRDTVALRLGIELHTEVRLVGFDNDEEPPPNTPGGPI